MLRRDFLLASAAAASLAAIPARAAPAHKPANAPPAREPRFKLALKYGMIAPGATVLQKFQLLQRLGYDGVELDSPGGPPPLEVRAAIQQTGIQVPGVVDSVHWSKPLSDPDPAVRAAGLEGLRHALRDAHAYGATSVLLVPAVVGKRVSYADAYRRSQDEIRKALPLAADLGVTISIENVWNHFLLSPLEAARYVDELDAHQPGHIGWHFDVGNIVNYGWPEHWIATLGRRITRLDIKEFSRKKRDDEGLWKGFAVEIGEGEGGEGGCDWPAVVAALAAINYNGWACAEVGGGDEARLADILARMRRILPAPAQAPHP
jgi:L-ribulose-5-phosphate 3-epimerase